jgi:hypothetical protein
MGTNQGETSHRVNSVFHPFGDGKLCTRRYLVLGRSQALHYSSRCVQGVWTSLQPQRYYGQALNHRAHIASLHMCSLLHSPIQVNFSVKLLMTLIPRDPVSYVIIIHKMCVVEALNVPAALARATD